MDFFDEVGKKFNNMTDKLLSKTKEFTDSTISQTKSMSDISKLKSQKKSVEKKLQSYYYQLGKAYYENSGDDCEYIYSEIVSVINDENKKLKDIIDAIDNINGVKRCQACKSKVSADSIYCNLCGVKLKNTQEKEIVKENDTDDLQNNLDAEPEAIEIEENTLQFEEEMIELPKFEKKICSDCGGEVPDDATFCTNCGRKYEG